MLLSAEPRDSRTFGQRSVAVFETLPMLLAKGMYVCMYVCM